MSLVESVNQLAAEVGGLAGQVVKLNRDVQHLIATYVPQDKLEERLQQEKDAAKMRRWITTSAVSISMVFVALFGWQEWQDDKDRHKAEKFGTLIVNCVVAAQNEMRQSQDTHYAQTAEATQRPKPQEAPTNGVTKEDVATLCEPVNAGLKKAVEEMRRQREHG